MEKMKGVFKRVKNTVKKKMSIKSFSYKESEDLLNFNFRPSFTLPENKMNCQILRSVSNWSVGLINKDENSIQKAYYDLIDSAKHYIFIENQFFISKSYADEEYYGNSNVVNQ